MQTDIHNTGVTNTTHTLDNPGFNQMEQSLSHAIEDFEAQPSAFMSTLTGYLRPVGDYSMRTWDFASGYVRRHPVQTVIGVVAIGFALSQLAKRNTSVPVSSDGRQY